MHKKRSPSQQGGAWAGRHRSPARPSSPNSEHKEKLLATYPMSAIMRDELGLKGRDSAHKAMSRRNNPSKTMIEQLTDERAGPNLMLTIEMPGSHRDHCRAPDGFLTEKNGKWEANFGMSGWQPELAIKSITGPQHFPGASFDLSRYVDQITLDSRLFPDQERIFISGNYVKDSANKMMLLVPDDYQAQITDRRRRSFKGVDVKKLYNDVERRWECVESVERSGAKYDAMETQERYLNSCYPVLTYFDGRGNILKEPVLSMLVHTYTPNMESAHTKDARDLCRTASDGKLEFDPSKKGEEEFLARMTGVFVNQIIAAEKTAQDGKVISTLAILYPNAYWSGLTDAARARATELTSEALSLAIHHCEQSLGGPLRSRIVVTREDKDRKVESDFKARYLTRNCQSVVDFIPQRTLTLQKNLKDYHRTKGDYRPLVITAPDMGSIPNPGGGAYNGGVALSAAEEGWARGTCGMSVVINNPRMNQHHCCHSERQLLEAVKDRKVLMVPKLEAKDIGKDSNGLLKVQNPNYQSKLDDALKGYMHLDRDLQGVNYVQRDLSKIPPPVDDTTLDQWRSQQSPGNAVGNAGPSHAGRLAAAQHRGGVGRGGS